MMIKGLNRPLFSGMQQQPTGLGGYYGAFGGGQMPQGGIMKYAPGGEVDKKEAEMKKVSDAYKPQEAGVREGSFLDYIMSDSGGGYRGDIAEIGGKIFGAPYDLPAQMIEELGYTLPEGSQSGTGYSTVMGGLDELLGVENRLPSETVTPEAVQWEDPEGKRITQSQAEEINAALRGEAEKAVTDPQANAAAAAVTNDAEAKLKKAENNEDIYGGMLALVPGAQVSDNPEENRKEVMRRLQQQGASMGIELSDDEADPQTNPHIGTALILAGSAMMQQTGNVGQAIGKGLETGASFLANKAEKEAERAAGIEEATIRSMYGGTDASVIQEAREVKRVYKDAFPNATDRDFYNFAARSQQADPMLIEQKLVDTMLTEASEQSATVAGNYAKMFVNSQTAMSLGEDNPKVAIGPKGDTLTMREAEAFAKNYMTSPETKKQAKDAGATSVPKALSVLGYTPIPLDQISKMSNIPAEGE
jgi:hypothetical protein